MEELVYLLKVNPGNGVADEIAARLCVDQCPPWVRLATIAPLSNYGYKPESEGEVLDIGDHGVVVGVAADTEIPRQFVPWQNIAYLADGASLAANR